MIMGSKINMINVAFNQSPLLKSAVSISNNLLIFSSKMATATMAPVKMARSLYCAKRSLRLSLVGGSSQYLMRVNSL